MSGAVVARPASAGRAGWSWAAGLAIGVLLLLVGGNLAGNGVLGQVDPAALVPSWEHGSLLRSLLLLIASWFSPFLDQETALVLVYAALATGGAALAFRNLRETDWPAWQALLVLVLVAGHGVILNQVTLASPDLLYVLGAALLIPAVRRLEAVGDVQAMINVGLAMALLLATGPALAPLIPLLVFAVPLGEPEARGNGGVFAAMLLVAAVPALIIIAGVTVMASRVGLGFPQLAAPFLSTFQPEMQPFLAQGFLILFMAPVLLVPILHLLIPDRRRKLWTTLLVLALPVYVALGNSFLAWELEAACPAALMVGTVLGWLCATRVRAWMRQLTLVLLALGVLSSWFVAPNWAQPEWLDGLWPIQLYGFSAG